MHQAAKRQLELAQGRGWGTPSYHNQDPGKQAVHPAGHREKTEKEREKDVETTSPKELQGRVAEKVRTGGELPHQEDQEKREIYTITRVNTLTSRLTEKGELGSKYRGDSNKEPGEQPIQGSKSSSQPIWKVH